MNNTTHKTVSEWDALEATKRAQLEELQSRLRLAEAKRADLLLLIGESPNDKGLKKDLETADLVRKDLALETEAVESLLQAIPERRNYARAREIEAEINELLALDHRLQELASQVDAAAEAFALEIGKYYEALAALSATNRGFFGDYRAWDIGALDSLGAFLRKHDLWKYIKVGSFRDATIMAEQKRNPARRAIAVLVSTMQKTAGRLRGELVEEDRTYCQRCYGAVIRKPIHTTGRTPTGEPVNEDAMLITCKICGHTEEIKL